MFWKFPSFLPYAGYSDLTILTLSSYADPGQFFYGRSGRSIVAKPTPAPDQKFPSFNRAARGFFRSLFCRSSVFPLGIRELTCRVDNNFYGRLAVDSRGSLEFHPRVPWSGVILLKLFPRFLTLSFLCVASRVVSLILRDMAIAIVPRPSRYR